MLTKKRSLVYIIFYVNQCRDTELLYEISHIILCRWTGTEMECSMDRQTVERRREYVQNIRNSFYEENGMQKRETREVDDSAPEMGLAAALKLRYFFICMYICSLF
mgnify:CR=1 FL=1